MNWEHRARIEGRYEHWCFGERFDIRDCLPEQGALIVRGDDGTYDVYARLVGGPWCEIGRYDDLDEAMADAHAGLVVLRLEGKE